VPHAEIPISIYTQILFAAISFHSPARFFSSRPSSSPRTNDACRDALEKDGGAALHA
jgi:hypothetical protein